MIRLFNRYWTLPATLSLLVEAGLLAGALWLAYHVRFWDEFATAYFYSDFLIRAAVFITVVILNLYANGLYDFEQRLGARELGIRLLRALTFSAVSLLVVYYITYPRLTTGRGVFAIAMVLGAALLTAWRVTLRWVLRRELFRERVLIVGTDVTALTLAREIIARRHLGYRVVGFVADDPSLQGVSLINPRVIGTTSQVCELALAQQVSRVVVAQQDKRGKLDMDRLLECKTKGIQVQRSSDFFEQLTGKIVLDGLLKSWLIFSRGFVVSPSVLIMKRLLDTVVAAVGLVLAAPLMLVTAIAIRLDSRGPVLFAQERVGRDGRAFTLWKFRSMTVDAEASGAPQWAEKRDPRTTPVGRFLRKTRIDELPQLVNVLVGDMSLVGPRPERAPFVEHLADISPLYRQRLVVRPGLTGWAQIKGAYAASFEESLEKLQYDLYYIKNLSLFLDISILASTARIILLGRGAR